MKEIVFTYKIEDLQREVEKRTSYLGKMRNADKNLDNSIHLLDRLSLTNGEDFLFREYLNDAANEMNSWFAAFERRRGCGMMMHDDQELKEYRLNYGVSIKQDNKEVGTKIIIPNENATINNPYFIPNGSDANIGSYYQSINVSIPQLDIEDNGNELTSSIIVICKTGVKDTPIRDEIKLVSNKNTGIASTIGVLQKLEEDTFGLHEILEIVSITLEITIEPNDIISYNLNDIVRYQDIGGRVHYYVVLQDCTEENFFENVRDVGYDYRNSIEYILDMPEWFELSMIKTIDNGIRECLICYIIWRWFESVYPSESDIYLKRYEDKARDVQLRLNSERKILRRHYRLF